MPIFGVVGSAAFYFFIFLLIFLVLFSFLNQKIADLLLQICSFYQNVHIFDS